MYTKWVLAKVHYIYKGTRWGTKGWMICVVIGLQTITQKVGGKNTSYTPFITSVNLSLYFLTTTNYPFRHAVLYSPKSRVGFFAKSIVEIGYVEGIYRIRTKEPMIISSRPLESGARN